MVPFHLRLLFAELLSLMGKDPELDALYALLAYCQRSEKGECIFSYRKFVHYSVA